MKNALKINPDLTEDILIRFLREEAGSFGFGKAVLGISGGVDSSVSAALAARAFGPENVLGVIMPYKISDPVSERFARSLAEDLGISTVKIDITEMADGYLEMAGKMDRVRMGNIFARCRMIVLYDVSAREKSLVIGTSNKSEILLGYSTLFGDSASAINPLGDLYKTQVYQLARHLGISEEIVSRKPTGDLWEGQTDEAELGFTYAEADQLLHCWIDRRYTKADLLAKGFKKPFVEKVTSQVRSQQYKRVPPVIAKLSNRTVNLDFRYMRDWGR